MAGGRGRQVVRLVYFGTSEFAVPALKAGAAHVVLVVTQPDREAGRGRSLRESPVKTAATELGLEVAAPEKCREIVGRVRELDADALLVASYGQILPEAMLGAARRGGINLHASLLPKYRGAAPIQRAILEGDKKTGVTLMQMDKGMDTGDIIAMEETTIGADEKAGELEGRLAEMAAAMATEWMPRIVAGDYTRTPQDDSRATLAPKVSIEDGLISLGMRAEEAYRKFRACTPRPGCRLETIHGRLKILECRMVGTKAAPGTVANVEGGAITVGFAGGSLELRQVQPEGRSAVSGSDFANGLRLREGASLRP